MIIFITKEKETQPIAIHCPNTVVDFVSKLEHAENVSNGLVYLPNYGRIYAVTFNNGIIWDVVEGTTGAPSNIEYYNRLYDYSARIVSAFAQQNFYKLAKQRQKDHDNIKAGLEMDTARRLAVEHTRTSDPVMDLGKIGE